MKNSVIMQEVQNQPTNYERFSTGVKTTVVTAAIAPLTVSAIPFISAGAQQTAITYAAVPVIGGVSAALVMATEGILVIGMVAASAIALVASIPMGIYAATR